MRAHAFVRMPEVRSSGAPAARQMAPGRKARCQAAEIRHILGRGAVQPKLKIGAVDDPLEREADRVADEVMRVDFPDPVSNIGPSAPDVERRCAECDYEVQRQADDEDLLQTKSNDPAPTMAAMDQDIATGISNGRPLSALERGFFQPRFGRDFDDVRLHTGSASDRAANTINARAFTLGSDIAFAEGEYRPESREGRRLLAHELTHVLQQLRPSRESNVAAMDTGGEKRLNVTAGRPEIRRQGPKNPITKAFGRWVRTKDVVPQHFNWPKDICSQAGNPIFEWAVDFETSLETGYIVQRIENVFDAENCDGTPFTGSVPTPLYWERWYVENHKMQTKKSSNYNANDAWVRNLCNPGTPFIVGCDPYPHATRGNWSMTGTLYILADTSNPGDFYRPNRDVPDAGNLEATRKDPGSSLGRPKGSRTASGSWDCCRQAPAQPPGYVGPNQLNRIGP